MTSCVDAVCLDVFAARRPPIDEIKMFLEQEKDWLVTHKFFPILNTEKIAQGLAGNTIDDVVVRWLMTRSTHTQLQSSNL